MAVFNVSYVPTRRVPVVLIYVPDAGPGTLTDTLMTQLLLAATDPLENAIDDVAGFAVSVGAPQPDVVAFDGDATTMVLPDSVGSVSLKLSPEISVVVGLAIVNVNVDVPFGTVVVGENALENTS